MRVCSLIHSQDTFVAGLLASKNHLLERVEQLESALANSKTARDDGVHPDQLQELMEYSESLEKELEKTLAVSSLRSPPSLARARKPSAEGRHKLGES